MNYQKKSSHRNVWAFSKGPCNFFVSQWLCGSLWLVPMVPTELPIVSLFSNPRRLARDISCSGSHWDWVWERGTATCKMHILTHRVTCSRETANAWLLSWCNIYTTCMLTFTGRLLDSGPDIFSLARRAVNETLIVDFLFYFRPLL